MGSAEAMLRFLAQNCKRSLLGDYACLRAATWRLRGDGLVRRGRRPIRKPSHPTKGLVWLGLFEALNQAAMNNEPKTPPSQALALERFALVAKIQDLLRQGFPLSMALEQAQAHLAVPVKVLYRRWLQQDPQ